jgi:adenylate kinase family enzyme
VIGRPIIVTGLAGSGNSTSSRSLAARTGLPVIHLDLHFLKPGWVAPTGDEWRDEQRRLLAGDAWIVDGNYVETLDLRLGLADTVVFLETPWAVCSTRALRRGLRPRNGELPDGCDEPAWRRWRDEWLLTVRVWRQRRSEPRREHQIISEHGRHAALHVLGSRRAAQEFLDGLELAQLSPGEAPPKGSGEANGGSRPLRASSSPAGGWLRPGRAGRRAAGRPRRGWPGAW